MNQEHEEYTSGCKHCGKDRTQLRGGACADCTDPSEWYGDWEGR